MKRKYRPLPLSNPGTYLLIMHNFVINKVCVFLSLNLKDLFEALEVLLYSYIYTHIKFFIGFSLWKVEFVLLNNK